MLGRTGPQFSGTLTQVEQERYGRTEGLFNLLRSGYKPQYNETIKSLQFCKLVRQINKNAEEMMGRLCLAALECHYNEIDSQLKDQFMHGLNDDEILVEIKSWQVSRS